MTINSNRGRDSIKERRRKKQRKQRLTVVVVATAVALLLMGLAFLPALWEALAPVGEIVIPNTEPRPLADFNTMGDPEAPVTIMAFSDFQCPYCKVFADETEPFIEANHVSTGEVYFIHRSMGNFISDNMRQGRTESIDAAAAAYCAGDQAKFWEYKDTLFANWEGEDVGSFTEKRLTAMAEELGLDVDQFSSCFNEGIYHGLARQDQLDGTNAGITGTPAFLINGKLVTGAQPYSEFVKEIEAAKLAAGN